MNRLRRALIVLAISLTVTVVALVVRSLSAAGVFTDVTPGFSGRCVALRGVTGAGAFETDRADNLLFVSATDRRALAKGKPNRADGIYVLSLANAGQGFRKAAGTPANFHPRGISLFRAADGTLTLMAVNLPVGGAPGVDIYDVAIAKGAVTLKERAAIGSGLLVAPEDIAAASPIQFYVSNGWASTSAFGRAIETYTMLPRANVVYFDGNVFRIVADGFNYANGLRLSADASKLYVATTSGRALYTFGREPFSGSLKEAGKVSIPSGLDKIGTDGDGSLWIAANPKLFAMLAFRADPAKPAPSQVFRVPLDKGMPGDAEAIYTNAGGEIGGASTATVAHGHLFIGSSLDSKVLDCALPGASP
jgi:arylesterase/paraoxonase